MSDLRYLAFYSFFGGVFFNSFLGSFFKHNMIMSLVFLVISLADLIYALKLYDKLKVK
jgi:hypothetical protein